MRLKEFRLRHGWSQKEMADRLFCSTVVYSRYETGARQPSLDTLIKLADIFGVSLDDLMGRRVPESGSITEWEENLLCAARRADARAREDALRLLDAHLQ